MSRPPRGAETGDTYDYVVIGSGAGGGTLAARLAEARMSVCVLEAGDDGAAAADGLLTDHYQVPAFHAFASENPGMSWNMHVEHYADPARRAADWKRQAAGILYPRAGTLGGCTAHNAMIFIRPPDSDWNAIARLTGDRSWRAARMNRYFRRIEACRHRPFWRQLARFTGLNPTGHGWNGWLPTQLALPRTAFRDDELVHILRDAAHAVWRDEGGWLKGLASSLFWALDPNNHLMVHRHMNGLFAVPLSTTRHARHGTRERLLAVQAGHSALHIETDALATRLVLDDDNRATGVEYLSGRRLYRASALAGDTEGQPRTVHARHEVIVAGGAFNTPQLLMLSGIGPAATLARHGIAQKIDLPGVGANLQDRYEVGVVSRVKRSWDCLEGATFAEGDPLYRDWADRRCGMYASNGAALAFTRHSNGRARTADPDLYIMALLTRFRGYFPGYSDEVRTSRDHLTWAVLKARTRNRAGTVTLRSADPRDAPAVDFAYFEEGSDREGHDLRAVVDAIRTVRRVTGRLRDAGWVEAEECPGEDVTTDAALADHVRANAWGHHACGTAAIGDVLTSDFRVRGTTALRVVDASAFPRIPGFFITCPIMMIAEKAADMILNK